MLAHSILVSNENWYYNVFYSQSAYRKCHSTETAVIIVYNDIVRAVDRGQLTALVLLDLSSAFDTADHSCIISVLRQRFNIEGLASD